MWRIVTFILHTISSKNIIVDNLLDNYASSVVSVESISPEHYECIKLIKKVITIVCVNITLLHISVNEKPCLLHEHVPPVHLLIYRISTYTLLLFLNAVENVRNMPLVTPSTGSVLSTYAIRAIPAGGSFSGADSLFLNICKRSFVIFCCLAQLNKYTRTILKTNILAFSGGYTLFPI